MGLTNLLGKVLLKAISWKFRVRAEYGSLFGMGSEAREAAKELSNAVANEYSGKLIVSEDFGQLVDSLR